MRIHILHTGKVNISKSLAFRDEVKNPNLFHLSILSSYGRRNRLWFPVTAYLIEHPNGLILYDTGWNREISPNGEYSRLSQIKHHGLGVYFANQALLPKNMAINEQLNSLGYETSDIDYVILSHLDVDHVSGLKHVSDAKRILVSNSELEFAKANKLRYVSSMWKGVNLDTFKFNNTGVGPVGKSFNLFNDGSVELVNIPGHTPGLAAMKLNNLETGEFVLLVSDGGYGEDSYKNLIMPGICLDDDLARKSLKWIRSQYLSEMCVSCLANHDISVSSHVIDL